MLPRPKDATTGVMLVADHVLSYWQQEQLPGTDLRVFSVRCSCGWERHDVIGLRAVVDAGSEHVDEAH